MPNPITPSISMQCNWIRDVLSGWAKAEGGIAVVAHDPNEMWQLAFNNSQVPRCIICYLGEEIRGDFSIASVMSRVDRQFVVLVTRARGYTANRGDTLTEQVNDARPFYDLLEEARDLIRVLQFDASVTEAQSGDPVDYKGIKNALPEDYPLDAYMIEFSIGTQLGVPYFNPYPPIIKPPSAPFNLKVTSGSAILTWDIDSFDADATAIFKSTDNGINYINYDFVNGPTSLTYNDTNVSSNSIYYYKISRWNTAGTSSFSNTASISFT